MAAAKHTQYDAGKTIIANIIDGKLVLLPSTASAAATALQRWKQQDRCPTSLSPSWRYFDKPRRYSRQSDMRPDQQLLSKPSSWRAKPSSSSPGKCRHRLGDRQENSPNHPETHHVWTEPGTWLKAKKDSEI